MVGYIPFKTVGRLGQLRDDIRLTRRMAHMLTSRNGRAFLERIGYVSGTPIVAADAEERLVDVFRRMGKTLSDDVLLAVFFAHRERICVLPMTRRQSMEACEVLETDTSSQSTIGMLVDDLYSRRADVRIVVQSVADRLRDVAVSEYDGEFAAA